MSNEDRVIEIMDQLRDELRTINAGFERLLTIFRAPPHVHVKDDRQTQSYAAVDKPPAPCQRDGCQRPSERTAYCSEHEHLVRG